MKYCDMSETDGAGLHTLQILPISLGLEFLQNLVWLFSSLTNLTASLVPKRPLGHICQ